MTEPTEQRHCTQGSPPDENFCPSSYVLDSYSHRSHLRVAQTQRSPVVVVVVVVNVALLDGAGLSPRATVSRPLDRVRAGQGGAAPGRTNYVSVLRKKKKDKSQKSSDNNTC